MLAVSLTNNQFADDTQVFLPWPAKAPAFLGIMGTFAAASGQHLNIGKTKILLLGCKALLMHAQQQQQQQQQPQQPQPKVVTSATVLGVTIGGETSSVFAERSPTVLAALKRQSRLKHLSAFGRGFGSAPYGVSKLLYAAEFSDLPSEAECRSSIQPGGRSPRCTPPA